MTGWPTPFLALAAVLGAWTFQLAGARLLSRVWRRAGWSPLESWMLGWLLWIPVCGAVGLAFAWADVARRDVLILIGAIVLAAGLLPIRLFRLPELGRWRWWALPVVLLKAVEIVFSGHPQRLYDQLNYHLVVSKLVLASGGLPGHHYDPHLAIAGPVEYAMLWPRAFVGDDLFSVAFGQAWIYAALVGTVALAALVVTQSRAFGAKLRAPLLLAALAVVPALIPNAEIAHMLKPNGLLLAGAAALLALRVASADRFVAALPGVALAMIAANQTFVHAAIAFAAVFALAWTRFDALLTRRATYLALAGTAVLAVAIGKSYWLTGTFLFPSDAGLFATPASDAVSQAYWHKIAFSESGRFDPAHLRGALDVLVRQPLLCLWLVVLCGAVWDGARRHRHLAAQPAVMPLVIFLVVFALAWPLFYDASIFSRFVAAYVGGLFALGFALLAKLPERSRYAALAATIVLGLGASHLEVMLLKIGSWSRQDAGEAFAAQFPRYHTSRTVNRLMAGEQGAVLADDAGKLFFDAPVLHGTLGPRERRLWEGLATDAKDVARSQGIKAVVVAASTLTETRDRYMVGPIAAVWRQLAPLGRVLKVGPDVVLYSPCSFIANPCPTTDAALAGEVE